MGGNSSNNNTGREQHYDSGLLILPNPFHSSDAGDKKPHQKMEQKIMILLANILFTTGYGYVIFLNIDNIKSVVLFFIMVVWGLVRILYYCIKQDHERRMRNLDYDERKRKLNEE